MARKLIELGVPPDLSREWCQQCGWEGLAWLWSLNADRVPSFRYRELFVLLRDLSCEFECDWSNWAYRCREANIEPEHYWEVFSLLEFFVIRDVETKKSWDAGERDARMLPLKPPPAELLPHSTRIRPFLPRSAKCHSFTSTPDQAL